MAKKLKVLFLCTGNSCRSQMAEGWARALWAGEIEPYSAGLVAHGLNPWAVRAMAEAGVDIRSQSSKTLEAMQGLGFDCVVTVCGHAHETCPVFPAGARVVHHGFDDPPRLAAAEPDDASKTKHYRRVRDEIRDYIQSLPKELQPCAI